ncbi:MAG: phage late control D family protein [Burkholderiaceae bacterium]
MTLPFLPLQASTIPEIKVDGQANADLARDLVRLEVEEDLYGMKRLAATLMGTGPRDGARDEPLNWMDGRVLDFGRELRVSMGPTTAREEVFAGKLSALELSVDQGRTPEVVCLAEDALMDLRMTRRFRTYEQASESELVSQIAAKHGLTAQCDVDGPTWAMVQQWNQSDLAFLRERARRLAAEVWVDGGRLRMATRDRRGGASVTLIQGNNLVQARLRADLAHQRSKLTVGGFDDGADDGLDESADTSAIDAEAQGHRHGAAVLRQALGERASYHVRSVPLKGDEARALAKAALLARARRFVTVSGIAEGSTALRVGAQLRLERVSPVFEGDGYYVTRVRHQFDLADGYRTHFDAEREWIGSGS